MRNSSVPCTLHHAVSRSSQPVSARGWRLTLPLLTLVCAAALSGCASGSYHWVKEGLSASLADAKYAACRRDAERLLESSSASEEARAAEVRRESYQCMKADGWSLVRPNVIESAEPASHPAGESAPAHGGEVRLAQASEPVSDKPLAKVEEKKEVKEVKVAGPPVEEDEEE